MTDHKLIAQFMRLRQGNGRVVLEVAIVMWDGPYTPRLEWQAFRRWYAQPSPGRLVAVRREALASPSFFARCATCGKRYNRGHMFSLDMCQGCAERDSGIVY